MAYQIKKLKQISNSLQRSKQEVLDIIMEDGKAKMREYVEKHWYGVYTPEDYQRTEDVLNCISAKIEGNIVTIFYDENLITHFHNNNNWGSHIGFNDEEFSIAYIEYGIGGAGVSTNPRRFDSGANAVRRLRGWLANYITKAVQKAFGASVKVRV